MGDYETVASIAAFMVISWLILVQGGAGQLFFNLPKGTTPPQLIPQEQDVGFKTVDLEDDAFIAKNITFKDPANLNNSNYSTEKVAVLKNGTNQGRLVFNTPGVKQIETLSGKQCGGFLGSSRLRVSTQINATGGFLDSAGICAETTLVEDADNKNYVNFRFQPPGSGAGTPQLYQMKWASQTQGGGVLGITIFDDIADLLSYPVRLWDYFEHFPFYITVFYGALLAYMVIDIFQIG